MYANVPPPEAGKQSSTGRPDVGAPVGEQETPTQPAYVSQEQWQRFQKLRDRRRNMCSKGSTQRINAMRKKTLNTVCREFSEDDKSVLAEEGVTLPPLSRKRARPKSQGHSATTSSATPSSEASEKWQELKRYLDPNPQLKGSPESSAQKSGLEQALDAAVERGELDKAVEISDNMANREFASQIATAFDCVEYVKKHKMERERKKKRPPKLKWCFEQKKRWETKGNM